MTGSRGARFLGLDVGTTNIKAQIVAEDGTVLCSGSASAAISYGADGAAEQDLEDIWNGTREAIRRAAAGPEASSVAAIGVSSQGGALQVVDAGGRCTGPVIGWQDSRAGAWERDLTERKGSSWFEQRIGFSRAFSSIGQLLRLRAVDALPRGCRVGWVGDIIVGRLCGHRAQDATSLSEAGLYNPRAGREDTEVLELLGLDRSMLPDLLAVDRAAGGLLPEVARELGLPAGIPVGPAVHDQYAAALGCGVVQGGDTMFGAGTAWVLLAVAPTLNPPVGAIALVGRHPVSGAFGQMLSMVNGGACIAWALRLIGREGMGVSETDALMATVPPGSDGLRFRPLLSRLGGSGLAPGTPGRLDGLGLDHKAAHVLRALVEGLACELGRYLGIMERGGVHAERLVMCGKAAASTVTPGIIADTTRLPVDCVTLPEASCQGAAVLARLLAEPRSNLAALSTAMKPRSRTVRPGPGAAEAHERLEEYLQSLSADGVLVQTFPR